MVIVLQNNVWVMAGMTVEMNRISVLGEMSVMRQTEHLQVDCSRVTVQQ